MKSGKKILSMLLVVVMVMSLAVPVLAEDEASQVTLASWVNGSSLTNNGAGDIFSDVTLSVGAVANGSTLSEHKITTSASYGNLSATPWYGTDYYAEGTQFAYVTFTVSTKGYENLNLQTVLGGNKRVPTSYKWAYSLDNETWVTVDTAVGSAYANRVDNAVTTNVALPAAAADQDTVYLRLMQTEGAKASDSGKGTNAGALYIYTLALTGSGDPNPVTEPTVHTHSYTATVVEPTCIKMGYTVYTCSCGYSYIGNYTDTIDHNYVNGVCSVCGDRIEDKHDSMTDNGVTYTFDGGTLTISGSGTCTSVWMDRFDSSAIKTVVITDGITNIGEKAFNACSGISEVTIPNSVTTISKGAFQGCTALTYVKIPSTVTFIGDRAFYLTGLTSVKVPGSVKSLGRFVFGSCADLVNVTIENGITTLPENAFLYCGKLKNVVLPSTLTSIEDYAFSLSGIEKISIPSGVKSIGVSAFRSCSSLKSIDIPVSVLQIGRNAFSGCSVLSTVNYGGSASKFNQISIASGNECLTGANIRYNSSTVYPFKDVNVNGSHAPFATAILWASNTGITTGYSGGLFKPDQGCTRAQVVTFLWRAAGSPEPTSYSNPFTDVSGSGAMAPYYKAILWAVEKGITSGYPDGTFRPNAVCTRAQFVTFLWRFEGQPAVSVGNPFTDVGSDSPFYTAILWAVESGVTTGYPDGTFRPNSTCTRAHVVTFIYRALA